MTQEGANQTARTAFVDLAGNFVSPRSAASTSTRPGRDIGFRFAHLPEKPPRPKICSSSSAGTTTL